ncbi:hypothetical protein ACQ4M3_20595 [Leptolyngbya sp. AN03gr2]|uniref:hypothetical protein n=1 Tax=unclassified Leptolyngbya TaxID=2650499 RepID=UPI003D316CA6
MARRRSNQVVFDVPTDKGRSVLGRIAYEARIAKRWSRKDVIDRLGAAVYISSGEIRSPYTISDSTLRAFEKGAPTRDPLLIDALAKLQYISHPAESRAYTAQELRLISYELLDAKTGQPKPRKPPSAVQSGESGLMLSSLAS